MFPDGIVKYMRSQVGPASKELTSVEVAEAFLAAPEVSVVYFGEDSKLKGKHQAGMGCGVLSLKSTIFDGQLDALFSQKCPRKSPCVL